MRIDVALKEKFNISRQKAKELITAGKVTINAKLAVKPSQEVSEEDEINIEDSDILKYVGRGGLKLEKALNIFNIDVTDAICIDIGASTGGFTDCLLQRGAKKVFAVDVGTSQLADKLKNDARVIAMENTDIREAVLERVDFICMDVSFISVTKVMNKLCDMLKEDASAVVLIKPQFEAGRENINKNGVVKNTKIHKRVIRSVADCAKELGFNIAGITYSPLKGGDGNIEYLLYITKKQGTTFVLEIDKVVSQAEDSLGR